jgi:Uma2 family endonuclease
MVSVETDYFTIIKSLPRGVTLFFHDVSWGEYKALLAELGEAPSVRLSYDSGTLQVMTISKSHENIAVIISRLFVAFEDELGCAIQSYRSATLKKDESEKGTEPDDCFYIQNAAQVIGKDLDIETDLPPDLAVEVDLTSPSLSKFPIYAALGVSEIWRYKGGRVQFFQLTGGKYHQINRSLAFPFLSPEILPQFIELGLAQGQTVARRAFAEWVRAHKDQTV